MRLLACLALLLPGRTPIPRLSEPDPISVPRLISALKQAENWDGHSIGKHGEFGALQWKKATWGQFSGDELRYAQWLIKACGNLGLKPSVTLCALIHNAGYGTVRDQKTTPEQREFAKRAANLYEASRSSSGSLSSGR